MLYFIGLGLGDAKDITVKGLEIVKKCSKVYLEEYTSILTCGKSELEQFYGRELIAADRDMVEQGADEILDGADSGDVGFLVVGDPFGATTHSDLFIRARERGIQTKVVHNASIMNAIGCCGLQLYNFGETVSIPFWTDTWQPDSFFDKILVNLRNGMHTLCLLDIKTKEQTVENMMRGRKIYEPARFMSTQVAADQLLQTIERRRTEFDSKTDENILNEETECVAVARIGSDDQKLVYAKLANLREIDLGKPLHSLIIIGNMHPLEKEAVQMFTLSL